MFFNMTDSQLCHECERVKL